MNFPANPYAASNHSHIIFRKEYIYLNALYYLIISCKEMLHYKLIDDLKGQQAVVGVITHVISQRKFQMAAVYREDAEKMANNFDGFVTVFNQQVFVSSHRAVINYLHNILTELFNSSLIKLKKKDEEQLINFGLSSKSLFRIISK